MPWQWSRCGREGRPEQSNRGVEGERSEVQETLFEVASGRTWFSVPRQGARDSETVVLDR